MSRFYASIQGSRGEATRQGRAASGMRGHVRGWHVGCSVYMDVGDDGEDRCHVRLTSGSNGRYSGRCLGVFSVQDLRPEEMELNLKSAKHWLLSKTNARRGALGHDWLYRTLKDIIGILDNDDVQGLFESEMAADGFFKYKEEEA